MPAFPRDELEEMLRRWIAANDEAGPKGDWSKMSSFFTEDAIYSWNNGPKTEFVARGRQQIHRHHQRSRGGDHEVAALLIEDLGGDGGGPGGYFSRKTASYFCEWASRWRRHGQPNLTEADGEPRLRLRRSRS